VPLRVGCSGWSYPEWVGPFYPPGTAQSKFLSLYAKAFDVVEVDSTFYRPPERAQVEHWRDATPAGFTFVPKLPQEVTGGRRAGSEVARASAPEEPPDQVLAQFLEALDVLGPKLGPIVAQFPPSYAKRGHAGEIATILAALGKRRAAFEFRHESWFESSTFAMLREHHAALVWSEVAAVKVPAATTSDFLVMRFIGDRSFEPAGSLVVRRDGVLDEWIERMKSRSGGLGDTFVFFNNHFEGFGPESVNRFRARAELPPVDWRAAMSGGRSQARLGEF
jgi:uncharacterized protein YecE (DUF72 family)